MIVKKVKQMRMLFLDYLIILKLQRHWIEFQVPEKLLDILVASDTFNFTLAFKQLPLVQFSNNDSSHKFLSYTAPFFIDVIIY